MDGDGKEDVAELLVNPSSRRFALFVKLAPNGQWQRVGKGSELKSLNNFGIAPVNPGSYKTACGKGYGDWACAHGEPDYLKVPNTAIDMFVQESADWIVYWDPRSKTFRQMQMSD